MLTYEPVTAEQYDEFLRLMRDEAADYLERTTELMQMTWEQFAHLFRTVGEVRGIYANGELAGFYWIEVRGSTLHLHGLFLKAAFQGQGIGTQVLQMLEAGHRGKVDAIELGVHESNARARALYERCGYRVVQTLRELQFHIMQKHLS